MLYDEPYDPYANIRRREQRERLRDDDGGPPMEQPEAKPISPWWYIVAISFILKVAHSLAPYPASSPVRSAAPPQTQETFVMSDGAVGLLVIGSIILYILIIIPGRRWERAKPEQAQRAPAALAGFRIAREREQRERRERAQKEREQREHEQPAWEREQQQRNQREARAQQGRERAQEREQREQEKQEKHEKREKREREQGEREQRKQRGGPPGTEQPSPWWEVLGVSQGSSLDEVKAAYRTKIKQCHPDRVVGLGEEFQQLADRKTKELNEAFNDARRCASA
jgi:hypothetical protein